VVVRAIEGTDRRDAISPYGYPGAAELPETPPDPAAVDWSETGMVSLFVRDRIGERGCLAGGTERSRVQIAAPGAASGIRKRLREQIRRNERRGWRIETIRGPEAGEEARAAFERAYAETMERTDAAERYLYPREYFERLLRSESAWLLLAAREDGDPAAGAIAAVSDGYLHYYLGGTAEGALADSPMKNLFAAMIALAGELGLPLNLGGGVRPGDSLESFKRGFAGAEAPFRTHEIICDPEAYEELSSKKGVEPGELQRRGVAMEDPGRPAAGFFPAYRR
jgi:Acetyltransferase (GNAT) domain